MPGAQVMQVLKLCAQYFWCQELVPDRMLPLYDSGRSFTMRHACCCCVCWQDRVNELTQYYAKAMKRVASSLKVPVANIYDPLMAVDDWRVGHFLQAFVLLPRDIRCDTRANCSLSSSN